MKPAPLLVIGIGNPSRGDDALGPLFIDRMARLLSAEVAAGQIELLTDFQLQIEHALDLTDRKRVVFVDASLQASPPFAFAPVPIARDRSHSTHALSPSAVLETHQRVVGPPPPAWCLALPGQRFDLGDPLSPHAQESLDQATHFFVTWCRDAATAQPSCSVRLDVRGVVQGVGFRPWVAAQARALGLSGRVFNTSGGVQIDAAGTAAAIDALTHSITNDAPFPARVDSVQRQDQPALPVADFTVAASQEQPGHALPLPPDLSLCAACARDIDDPHSRFAGYPFVSCTRCGPRFSIANALPFDRQNTSLAAFPLCATCATEYADINSRRCHAQTLTCPHCGPRLWLCTPDGAGPPTAASTEVLGAASTAALDARLVAPDATSVNRAVDRNGQSGSHTAVDQNGASYAVDAVDAFAATDPIGSAAQQILDGKILGILGLGGMHLVCDATCEAAVQALRDRKRRDAKPFAVMVRDLDMAASVACIDAQARALLDQPARPIVLLPGRDGTIAPSVCAGTARVGLMLPYSGLHHLLLSRVGRPLVMTSGNLSGEPITIVPTQAVHSLGALVDGFVLHDRPIVRRVEDSVMQVSAIGPQILRRARGFAPLPIRLPQPAPEPILAVGGHLKNTVCIVIDDRAYLSPHLGDLHTVDSEYAWQREIESLQRLLRVHPDVLAHDQHPDYASTHYALRRPARLRHAVQHHAAHLWAAQAELHIDGPILGVVFDGSGWGPDGTSWGGEILHLQQGRIRRVAALRPLPLPGGEAALRDVWRQGLALLFDAFGDDCLTLCQRLPGLRDLPGPALQTTVAMMRQGLNTVPARGLGRYFDAVAALVLGANRAQYEAQQAMALEDCADRSGITGSAGANAAQGAGVGAAEGGVLGDQCAVDPYPWNPPQRLASDDDFSPECEIDLRPLTCALVDDLLHETPAPQVAARFHATIAAATLQAVARAQIQTATWPVVLTGGSMQNRRLLAALQRGLGDAAHIPRQVPVNDGGLSIGQAYAAVVALRAQQAAKD